MSTTPGCKPEKLKDELLSIVEAFDSARLALFYSSDRVKGLLEKLYERWESAGRLGEPLDYADCEELALLLEEARRARSAPAWHALRVLMGLEGGE